MAEAQGTNRFAQTNAHRTACVKFALIRSGRPKFGLSGTSASSFCGYRPGEDREHLARTARSTQRSSSIVPALAEKMRVTAIMTHASKACNMDRGCTILNTGSGLASKA